jgi:hypothetical protein
LQDAVLLNGRLTRISSYDDDVDVVDDDDSILNSDVEFEEDKPAMK